jgi:hypothetical protein
VTKTTVAGVGLGLGVTALGVAAVVVPTILISEQIEKGIKILFSRNPFRSSYRVNPHVETHIPTTFVTFFLFLPNAGHI